MSCQSLNQMLGFISVEIYSILGDQGVIDLRLSDSCRIRGLILMQWTYLYTYVFHVDTLMAID